MRREREKMYYFTRIELDPYKKLTQLALNNSNMFHGAIEKTFNNTKERKLWRVDSLRGRRYLLIISRSLPDFTPLLQQFAPNGAESQTKVYDSFLDTIKNNSMWHFRLCGVPLVSKKTSNEPNARGKRYALIKEEEQREWLYKKGELHGFTIDPDRLVISDMGASSLKKGAGKDHCEFKIRKVVYEGMLMVTDVDAFRAALVDGVGRERAFGGGMITIAPI